MLKKPSGTNSHTPPPLSFAFSMTKRCDTGFTASRPDDTRPLMDGCNSIEFQGEMTERVPMTQLVSVVRCLDRATVFSDGDDDAADVGIPTVAGSRSSLARPLSLESAPPSTNTSASSP